MAQSRSTNTQSEALKNLVQELALMKTYPDADIEMLVGLETQILDYMKKPLQTAGVPQVGGPGGGMGGGPPGMPPGMGPPPGIPPGMGPPPGAGPPPPMPPPGGLGSGGPMTLGAMPPIDEIRRMMRAR